MEHTSREDPIPHGDDGETRLLSRESGRSSLPPHKASYSVVAVRQLRPKRRVWEQFDLRGIMNLALGPLSDLVNQLRLLERKRDMFRYLVGRGGQPRPLNNLVAAEGGRIKSLEVERDQLSRDLAYWQDQYNELTAHSNAMVDTLQKLQSNLDLQSENDLVEQFEQVYSNIKSCIDEFQRKNPQGKSILSKPESRYLLNLVGLHPESDRDFLQYDTGRKHLSRAYICRMLVKTIFYSEKDDGGQIKDLWASKSTAKNLATMENKMKEIDLFPGEFNKWRSTTVRHLARKTLEENPRVEILVDELLQMLLAIFGMTEDFLGVDTLRANLKSSVVSKAVILSQSLRKQLSNISISNPGNPNRDALCTPVSSLSIADRREDFPNEQGVVLMVFPAMVRSTDELGAMAMGELILVLPKYIWLGRVMDSNKGTTFLAKNLG